MPLSGRSSMVELKPSKLMTRVRFPSPAPSAHKSPRVSSAAKICPCGSVVEHSLGKGEVAGPIPAMGTKKLWLSSFGLFVASSARQREALERKTGQVEERPDPTV
jgi:hypothetical protein